MRQYTCTWSTRSIKEKWTERLLKIQFSKLLKDKQPQIQEIQRALAVQIPRKTPPTLLIVKLLKSKDKGKFFIVTRGKKHFLEAQRQEARTDSLSEIKQAGDGSVTPSKNWKKKKKINSEFCVP